MRKTNNFPKKSFFGHMIPLSIFSEATRVFLLVDHLYNRFRVSKGSCSVYRGGKKPFYSIGMSRNTSENQWQLRKWQKWIVG